LTGLVSVKRFVILWTLLFVALFFGVVLQLRALGPHYQTLKSGARAVYSLKVWLATLPMLTLFTHLGAADTSVSRLIFSGLFKYDNDNKLTGDLAKDWILKRCQTRYTVNLRKDISGKTANLYCR
jgi:ABC-type transport system substrate-binding protein